MADADDTRDERGRWRKGATGNPGGKSPAAHRIRQLLDPHREALVAKAVQLALDGDPTALSIVISRLAPPPRAQHEPVEIDGLAEAATPGEQAAAILRAVGRGQLAPDVAQALLGALNDAHEIATREQLEARLAKLETAGLL